MSAENGKVCCNCAHCIRSKDEKYNIVVCRCDVHDMYLSYASVMGGCCKHWTKKQEGEEIGGRVMEELKPCPFCGEPVHLWKVEHPRLYRPVRNHPYCVVCNGCDLLFGFDEDYGGIFDTEEEAIEAWNRRASDDSTRN